MISRFGTIEKAPIAFKKGAYDFIPKPADLKMLEVVISRALERHNLFKQLGFFRGLTLALVILLPIWVFLAIVLTQKFLE